MTNPSEIYATWQRGVPLSQAFYHFMPQTVQEKWKSLSEENSTVAVFQRLQESLNQGNQSDPAQFVNRFEGVVDHDASRALSTLEDQLKTQCHKWIRTGLLKAYGFPAPRTAHDMPIEVPSDLWEQPPYWSSDAVQANGLKIEAVRLVLPDTQPPPSQTGRPSRRIEMSLAFEELVSNGRIDSSGTLKAAAQLVQQHIVDQTPDAGPDTRGLGLRAIEKQISKHFQSIKTAAKKE